MARGDGTITLETRVNTKGIESDAMKLANKFKAATYEVEKQTAKIKELKQRLDELNSGKAVLSDKAIIKQQTEYDKLIAKLDELKAKEQSLAAEQSNIFSRQITGNKDRLLEQYYSGSIGKVGGKYFSTEDAAQLTQIKTELSAVRGEIESTTPQAEKMGAALKKAVGAATQQEIVKTTNQLTEEEIKLGGLKAKAAEAGEKLKNGMKGTQAAALQTGQGFARLGKNLLGIGKSVFVFSVLTKALSNIRTAITNVIMSDDKFRESLRQLKAAFWTAFAPIYDFVIPALRKMMSYLTQAITSAGKLMAKLTGMSYGDMVNKGENLSKQTTMYKGDKTDEEKAIEKRIKAIEKENKALQKQKKAKEKAQKAQEKANKRSLASFDEIDKLSFDKDTSEIDALDDEIDKNDELIDQLQEQLDLINEQKEAKQNVTPDFTGLKDAGAELNPVWAQMLDTMGQIKDVFMSGFWEGFASADFDGIKNSISGIKENIKEIAADPAVQQSASNLANAYIKFLGQMSGAVASMGVTIADNILGGFEYYLSQNKDRIKLQITDIFNITADIANIVGDWWTAIADIFSVLADENGKKLTGEIIGIFADTALGLAELGLKLGRDFINIFAGAITDNKEGIKTALDGILKFFSDIAEDIHSVVKHLFDQLNKLYDEHVQPLMETIKKSWSDVVQVFVDKWNQYMQPVLDDIADKFHDVVENHVNPMIDSVIEFLGKWFDEVKKLWDNALSPLAQSLVGDWVTTVSSVFHLLGEEFNTLLSTASDVISGIAKALGGLIDFLDGVFTGNWKKALEGLKGIFKGVVNSLISIVEGGVNLIINALNTPLDAINRGMDSMGMGSDNIPTIPQLSIPRLAKGAVLKPNNPFLAVVGDQKRGTNIEAPLSTIRKAVSDVINGGVFSALKNVGTGLVDILSQIGQLFGNVSESIMMKLEEITTNQSNVITLISNFLTNAADYILKGLGQGFGKFDFGSFFDKFKENFIEVLNKAFENVQTQIYSVLGWLQQIQSGVQILVLAKTSYDEIRDILHEHFVGLYDCISTKTDYIASLLMDIKAAVSQDDKQSISGENGLTTTHDYTVTDAGIQYKNFYDNILSRISEAVQSVNLWLKGDLSEQINAINDGLGSINFSISLIGNGISSSTGIRIPKMASGGVIPPNREFLAVLGDQKSGTNIEAPLDTIKQAVAEVVGSSKENINISFTGSLSQLARVLQPQIKRENRRVGKTLLSE